MHARWPTVVVILWFITVAAGCAHDRPTGAAAAPAATSPAHVHPTRTITLARQTLVFQPTRDDITVGCAIFTVAASHPDAVRVNGVAPTQWRRFYLPQFGRNRFELPAMTLECPADEPDQIVCMSVKVWFNELTNQYDGMYYEHLDDRYALLAWCSRPPEAFPMTEFKARFGQNRAETLEQFTQTLAKAFVIHLNHRPLREEWGQYPMINPLPPPLDPAELKAIAQTVRDRGETYVTDISVTNPTHAAVFAGNDSIYHAERLYQVAKSNGIWQVVSVKSTAN